MKFHPQVSEDIQASYQWYQKQALGLGDDFIRELESAYAVISDMPQTWPFFQKDFKRYILSKFPYSVIYQADNKSIFYCCCYAQQQKAGVLAPASLSLRIKIN